MQVKFKVLIPFLIQFQKNLKHFIVLQLNLCKGKRPLVPILSVVTDGGFGCVSMRHCLLCASQKPQNEKYMASAHPLRLRFLTLFGDISCFRDRRMPSTPLLTVASYTVPVGCHYPGLIPRLFSSSPKRSPLLLPSSLCPACPKLVSVSVDCLLIMCYDCDRISQLLPRKISKSKK